MTLQEALSWWSQPHIKAALAQLTDLAQARAKAIAANDATHAVTALQSCTVLADTEFYEQADPKTRLKAFESARKAAGQVLRLAGFTYTRPAPTGQRATAPTSGVCGEANQQGFGAPEVPDDAPMSSPSNPSAPGQSRCSEHVPRVNGRHNVFPSPLPRTIPDG
jgi:hypothetical protein